MMFSVHCPSSSECWLILWPHTVLICINNIKQYLNVMLTTEWVSSVFVHSVVRKCNFICCSVRLCYAKVCSLIFLNRMMWHKGSCSTGMCWNFITTSLYLIPQSFIESYDTNIATKFKCSSLIGQCFNKKNTYIGKHHVHKTPFCELS